MPASSGSPAPSDTGVWRVIYHPPGAESVEGLGPSLPAATENLFRNLSQRIEREQGVLSAIQAAIREVPR